MMASLIRLRTLSLLFISALVIVTTGFLFVQSAQNSVTLPIEVIGPDGHTKSVTVVGSNASQTQHVYLQAHSIGYPYFEDYTVHKASIRINGGAWTDITNNIATCEYPESQFDCIVGPYPTIRFEIPVSAIGGTLQDGSNVIDFRFNYAFPSDSPDDFGDTSTGYRILNLELRDGADIDLIDGTTFVWDDPANWTAPDGYDNSSSVSDGEVLWHQRDLLVEGWDGKAITASCNDCHAENGRDLQYFAFSNESIIARSAFHGLTVDEGKKIAAFIRSYELKDVDTGHTYEPPARPWTPTYQPGPTSRASRSPGAARTSGTPIHQMPGGGSQYLAAGAGLEWALDRDSETRPYLFPGGAPENFDYDQRMKMWTIPVQLQFPDWNEWLPVHHPLDILGDDFKTREVGPRGINPWDEYTGGRLASFKDCFTADGSWENDGGCVNNLEIGLGRLWKGADYWENDWDPALVEPGYTNTTHNHEPGWKYLQIMRWANVKIWDIIHTYDLSDLDEDEGLEWPNSSLAQARFVFEHAPHLKDEYAGPKEGSWDLWLDNAWYEMNTRINHGEGRTIGNGINDWKYQHMHMKGFWQELGLAQPMRFWTSWLKLLQICDSFNAGNRGVPQAWITRLGHCGINTLEVHGQFSYDALEGYEPGLGLRVHTLGMQIQLEEMMYKHSPVTYDQSTGTFTGDVDANYTRTTSQWEWESETFDVYFGDGFKNKWKDSKTPNNYLNALDIYAGRGMRPTLLDSMAAWNDAMVPEPEWDAYRCQSNGGTLDCPKASANNAHISLTAPAAGAGFTAPASIAITASSDTPDKVVQVDFYASGTHLGTRTVSFEYLWTNIPAGTYSLWVEAVDDDGVATASDTVSITVASGGAAGTSASQTLDLKKGWNLLSTRLAPEPSSVSDLLSAAPNITLVKDENGNTYLPGEGVDHIGYWNPFEGYMIYSGSAQSLSVSGHVLRPEYSPISLEAGWNLVTYLPASPLPADEAFASIAEHLVLVKDGAGRTYIPGYNVDDIGDLQPGQGYKVFVDQPTELTYPAATAKSTRLSSNPSGDPDINR